MNRRFQIAGIKFRNKNRPSSIYFFSDDNICSAIIISEAELRFQQSQTFSIIALLFGNGSPKDWYMKLHQYYDVSSSNIKQTQVFLLNAYNFFVPSHVTASCIFIWPNRYFRGLKLEISDGETLKNESLINKQEITKPQNIPWNRSSDSFNIADALQINTFNILIHRINSITLMDTKLGPDAFSNIKLSSSMSTISRQMCYAAL